MSLPQVAAYVWLGQALLGVLPWNVDAELQEKMMSGAVAYELLRPVDLYAFWYARTIALRTATTFMRMMPMIVFAAFLLPLVGLERVGAAAAREQRRRGSASLVSLAATVVLASAITMLMHVALIWTLSGRGFNTVMTGVVIGVLRAGHPAAAVPGLAAAGAVLAAVPRSRRRAVSHLQRQHRSADGRARNRPASRVGGADRRLGGYALMAYGKSRVVVQGG